MPTAALTPPLHSTDWQLRGSCLANGRKRKVSRKSAHQPRARRRRPREAARVTHQTMQTSTDRQSPEDPTSLCKAGVRGSSPLVSTTTKPQVTGGFRPTHCLPPRPLNRCRARFVPDRDRSRCSGPSGFARQRRPRSPGRGPWSRAGRSAPRALTSDPIGPSARECWPRSPPPGCSRCGGGRGNRRPYRLGLTPDITTENNPAKPPRNACFEVGHPRAHRQRRRNGRRHGRRRTESDTVPGPRPVRTFSTPSRAAFGRRRPPRRHAPRAPVRAASRGRPNQV
jgi:hypothetical protein